MGHMGDSRKRIAVIGSGISGLGAAYLLRRHADVTLYEKNDYIGGHTRTLEVEVGGKSVPVDTGFIVYNNRNYPLLSALFEELDVPVVKSDMSFGVSIGNGWLEYAPNGLGGIFGSSLNLFSPGMWRMVRDIFKFNREAMNFSGADAAVSLGECLDHIGVGDWFRRYYLLPMGGSIWSCPVEKMLEFPAASFIRFFNNHGLLTIKDHPQWYSVRGGSREYVKRIFDRMGGAVRIRPGALQVNRLPGNEGIEVEDTGGEKYVYHADETLAMLGNPTEPEAHILKAFKFQPNRVILHTDTSFMPKRRSAWASWIYQSEQREDHRPAISLSYWMNNLQDLQTDQPVIVTLNPSREPATGTLLNEHIFDHPVFDEDAIRAQDRITEIQGKSGIWYCGAWQRNGFHEDGLWSAVRMVESMGLEVDWK